MRIRGPLFSPEDLNCFRLKISGAVLILTAKFRKKICLSELRTSYSKLKYLSASRVIDRLIRDFQVQHWAKACQMRLHFDVWGNFLQGFKQNMEHNDSELSEVIGYGFL